MKLKLLLGILFILLIGVTSVSATDPPKPYISEFKGKIIEMGISEEYFNENIVLIYSGDEQKEDRLEAKAVYQIKTGTWADNYFPTDIILEGKDTSGGLQITAWMNKPNNESFPTVWSVSSHGSRIWWDDEIRMGQDVALHEIDIVLSEEEATNLAKECLGNIEREPNVFFSLKEPSEGGTIVEFVAESNTHQVRIDLESGKVLKCEALEIRDQPETEAGGENNNSNYLYIIIPTVIILIALILLLLRKKK